MKTSWIRTGVLVALWATIAVAGFGSAVWQLWNWLMPGIFGLRPIAFGQAVGLLGLCWLLFGGWRWGGGHRSGRRGVPEEMTSEERERLRAAVRSRCGVPGATRQP